ncbi:cellulose biosynthesis protein BcsR [Martelella alba]|uniref:Cellulose biosynthesis protein BcsR n=1 Tax=Martelella alba TaxID=2590451 RepID=A0ABY2SP88_9HYPH|nr:cellulose biosynthesis protein BcsR [Martelella alba]TKI07812.1 hypothetical protein FCN80_05065 [Martelella alba]
MGNRLFTVRYQPLADSQDDVMALRQIFELADIGYADIRLQEQLPGILARWPLLAEFAERDMSAGSPGAAAMPNE